MDKVLLERLNFEDRIEYRLEQIEINCITVFESLGRFFCFLLSYVAMLMFIVEKYGLAARVLSYAVVIYVILALIDIFLYLFLNHLLNKKYLKRLEIKPKRC